MNKKSKAIGKADDDAKILIIEALEEKHTGGFDLDSIYLIEGKYHVLEFLKCDTVRPNESHPKRYWFKNSQKFISLWNITQKLEGVLYLVNYEASREQFKVIKVLDLDETGITKEKMKEWGFIEFKKWFQDLNSNALKG